MNQRNRVLAAVEQQPLTYRDVAEITGLPRPHCAAYLSQLYIEGVLDRTEIPRGGFNRHERLYSLKKATA